MDASLSPAVKYFSKRSKRRSSAEEALKPLKELFQVLEEKLYNLETSLCQTSQNLNEIRNPWERLSRPRTRLYRTMSQDKGKPMFNRFVRARHTGASPFRPNINLPSIPGTRSRSPKPFNLQPGGKENRTRDATNAHRRGAKKAATPVYTYLQEPENGPSFHRNQLEEETARLLASASQWELVKTSTPDLNDEIIGEIDCVVNGIRLLVSSKFEQFRGLIENCAKNYRIRSRIPVASRRAASGSNASPVSSATVPAVLPEDLDGFWSVIALQVDNLKKRSDELDVLKTNGWVQVNNAPVSKHPAQPKPAKKTPRPATSGRSRFREFLLKKKEELGQSENTEIAINSDTPTGSPPAVSVSRPSIMPDLVPISFSLNNQREQQIMDTINSNSTLPSIEEDSLPPLEHRHVRPPRSSISLSLTPRVIHNIEKARNSRRFSTGIIVQQSHNGRYAPDLQSPIESNLSSATSNYSSATSTPRSSLND
ncbi:Guanylate-kinase-associated protein (GKAP) protein [Nesidiocoris tenuis]|uniref:Guanylate-kinase-associated protein (GKAP) protein n=1 Tax=Nesidiocoris tenuis TaxID=355587 RepID=A0ABN7AKV4_9HEMI|nr:Guanylate-kinase-associated protein (GKAP) protein [Nesidiocoris tenuis]